MHPVDIEKMTVMAPFRLFNVNCLPFGLHNADSTLQLTVDCVLAYQHFALPTEMTSLWPDAITWNISFISARFWSACSILVWLSTAVTSVFSARLQQAFWATKCSSRALFCCTAMWQSSTSRFSLGLSTCITDSSLPLHSF